MKKFLLPHERVHEPKGVRYVMTGTRGVGQRADLLDASRILEEAALDKYVFQRDAYLQRRRSQVHDGNPPRASRELPLAEAPVAPPPVVWPNAAAVEAAVRLPEQPASTAAGAGG